MKLRVERIPGLLYTGNSTPQGWYYMVIFLSKYHYCIIIKSCKNTAYITPFVAISCTNSFHISEKIIITTSSWPSIQLTLWIKIVIFLIQHFQSDKIFFLINAFSFKVGVKKTVPEWITHVTIGIYGNYPKFLFL